jgi:hypothetical protein
MIMMRIAKVSDHHHAAVEQGQDSMPASVVEVEVV